MTIYFYSATDPYYEFSNFAPFGIEVNDVWWSTVEHWFQAQKFHDEEYQDKIRRAPKPKEAANLGRSRTILIRQDWESIKDELMLQAVRIKFRTHSEPRNQLLATGNEEIMEASPYDYYWGCGADGSGQNRLGNILVQVREELRNNLSGQG